MSILSSPLVSRSIVSDTRPLGLTRHFKGRQGGTYSGLFHITDWLSTIVEGMAGSTLHGNLEQDGYNQWPAILQGGDR